MSDVEYVWAASTAMVDGFRIDRGDTWYKYDPIVLANPSLFTDDPRVGLRATAPVPESSRASDVDRVEQVTAGPGEKRNVRRA